MLDFFSTLNWLSVATSTAILIITGVLYYSPRFMGGPWMKSLNIKPEDFARKTNMKAIIAASIIFSLCLHFHFLHLVNAHGHEGNFDTFKHGAWHGAGLGLLVATPAIVISGLYELRSLTNLCINVIYWIILLSLLGGTIDAMNHWSQVTPS